MKVLLASSLCVNLLWSQTLCQEIQKEIQRLEELRAQVEKKLQRNEELLRQIRSQKEELQRLQKELEKELEEIKKERYKKLAKDFESMDPEAAGEKLSKMSDPKIAAYIVYNMSSRKAGEVLGYTDAAMVDKIAKILTQLRKNDEE